MVDGTYSVKVRTPMGVKRGTIRLESSEGRLSGAMEALGSRTEFDGGTVEGDDIRFAGSLKTPMGLLRFDFEGTADGSSLSGTASTTKGVLSISGTRA